MENAAETIAIKLPTKPLGVLGDHLSKRIGTPAKELVNTICIPPELTLNTKSVRLYLSEAFLKDSAPRQQLWRIMSLV